MKRAHAEIWRIDGGRHETPKRDSVGASVSAAMNQGGSLTKVAERMFRLAAHGLPGASPAEMAAVFRLFVDLAHTHESAEARTIGPALQAMGRFVLRMGILGRGGLQLRHLGTMLFAHGDWHVALHAELRPRWVREVQSLLPHSRAFDLAIVFAAICFANVERHAGANGLVPEDQRIDPVILVPIATRLAEVGTDLHPTMRSLVFSAVTHVGEDSIRPSDEGAAAIAAVAAAVLR